MPPKPKTKQKLPSRSANTANGVSDKGKRPVASHSINTSYPPINASSTQSAQVSAVPAASLGNERTNDESEPLLDNRAEVTVAEVGAASAAEPPATRSPDIPRTHLQAPPPQNSNADKEASYRFGASVAWKLGSFFGFTGAVTSIVGYANLENSNLAQDTIPFCVAIGTIFLHALLLLAISVRLGAYRAPHYHHTHATALHSNPVSKVRIHAPAAFIAFGLFGFSGGLLAGLFLNDYSLDGFWPFIPAGALSLTVAWALIIFL
ncbi:hypothetical protein HDU78_008712 [Chytriomyces hyalinus]|nr:hypothetical protein HDU78_008712 [Chytriomyces hyalinus]